MSLIKKLAGETAIYGVSSILGRLVSWVILTPYLTSAFIPAEYGIVNELYFYIAFLLVLFTYRMETAYFRFASRAKDKEEAGTIFSTVSLSILSTTIAFATLLLCLAPSIASWLKYPGRTDYVQLFTLIIAFDALAAIPFAKLRLDNRPIRFAAIKLVSIATNITLVFFFLEGCPWLLNQGWEEIGMIYNPERRVAYVFWANLIASSLTLVWLAPLFRSLVWRFAQDVWAKMLRYSAPLVIASLAGITNSLVGTPLLKTYGPGASLEENLALGGIYAAASKLAVLMSLFIQAFNYAAEPFFFRQAANSQDKTIYVDVARAFALVGALAFVGIMLYLDLIQYFLGKDFREGLGILPILLLANFLLGLFYNFSIAYKLTDRTAYGGYIAVGGVIVTLTVNFTLMPSLTYYAPAWAALSCYSFMVVVSYIVARRLWPVDYAIGRMFYYIIWALSIYSLCWWLDSVYTWSFWVKIIVNTMALLIGLSLLWYTEKPWLKGVWKKG